MTSTAAIRGTLDAVDSQAGRISVQLKSGGPVMTVQDDTLSAGYRCQWFAGKKLESGFFPEESLVAGKTEPQQAAR